MSTKVVVPGSTFPFMQLGDVQSHNNFWCERLYKRFYWLAYSRSAI